MWIEGSTVLIKMESGNRYVRVMIFSDSVPATMPTTGSGIDGLNGDDILSEGCKFYSVSNGKLFILNSQGNWVEQ